MADGAGCGLAAYGVAVIYSLAVCIYRLVVIGINSAARLRGRNCGCIRIGDRQCLQMHLLIEQLTGYTGRLGLGNGVLLVRAG